MGRVVNFALTGSDPYGSDPYGSDPSDLMRRIRGQKPDLSKLSEISK